MEEAQIISQTHLASRWPACYSILILRPEKYAYLSVTDAFSSGKAIVDTEPAGPLFKDDSRGTWCWSIKHGSLITTIKVIYVYKNRVFRISQRAKLYAIYETFIRIIYWNILKNIEVVFFGIIIIFISCY